MIKDDYLLRDLRYIFRYFKLDRELFIPVKGSSYYHFQICRVSPRRVEFYLSRIKNSYNSYKVRGSDGKPWPDTFNFNFETLLELLDLTLGRLKNATKT